MYNPAQKDSQTNEYERARSLVRHLPITVERYDSGRIGFVARPTINGKRFNQTFSTWSYPNLETAAEAAKNFCNEKLNSTQVESSQNPTLREIVRISTHALAQGKEPLKALKMGLAFLEGDPPQQATSPVRIISKTTVSQAIQAFMDSKRAGNVTEPYLKELETFYGTLGLELGGSVMADVTALQIEALLEKLTRLGRIRSDSYRKRWLSKFAFLWDFATGRGWAPRNIIEDLQSK